ncbi:MAG TPA: FAD-binding protein, partial [Negativicutes bacterium]|nr:FAD-binding protein [Negativicutes bacterium]
VDPATARIEVTPGAHYLLGGIHINEECRTTIDGLFATPECAGNFDGANRLAGSGIAATQVFGTRAGRYANQWASANSLAEVDAASVEEEVTRVGLRLAGHSAADKQKSTVKSMRDRLRAAMQQHAGVRRDQAGLEQLANVIREIQEDLQNATVPAIKVYNQPLLDLLQLETMCEVAALVAKSALLRTESRGHHFRQDYPAQNDEQWLRHTRIAKIGTATVMGTKALVVQK